MNVQFMKVLFIFNHPAPYKVNLFNGLAKSVDLDVIFERKYASDRPKDFYNCNEYNFNVTFFTKGYVGKEGTNTNELVQYIKSNHQKYDLIILNGYSHLTEMKAIKYMHKNNIKFVLYINGGVIKHDNIIKKAIKKYFITKASAYMSPSSKASEYLIHYGADKNKIFEYPYSTIFDKDIVSVPLTIEEKNKIRRKWYITEDRPLLITASQFIERKNIEQVLRVFAKNKLPLLLIGSGPLRTDYLEYIRDNDLNNIKMMGFLKKEDLFEVMRSADYFITLSKEDIYGHTINEAMANGLPVISSNKVVAASKLIKNGYNGFIVPLKDNEVQAAIDKLDNKMAANAINVAKENTFEKEIEAHLEIFKEIIKC